MRAEFPEAFEFLFEHHRYKGVRGGRGKGASWNIARALLLIGGGDIPGYEGPRRILCARETQKSIADSVHALLGDQIKAMELTDFYTVQQHNILGKNSTEFIFAGLKHNITNIKSVEACDIAWVEEAQSTSKDSWATLIPTIRKEGSEIWLSWNDILSTDDTHKRFVLAPPPGAVIKKLTWRDNPYFPEVLRVEMEHLKATNYEDYLHVWEGECKSNIEGAIFGKELKEATAAGRICSVPYNRTLPVHTAWDLGFGDLTAIWFFQVYGGFYNFIDYTEGDGKVLADYLIELQNKGYVYGTDWLPHDGIDTIIHRNLSGGDRSRSIEQLMRTAGHKVRIAPKLYIADRINAARTIFGQCRFDESRCADGIQGLRHYQWGEIDEARSKPGMQVRKGGKTPLHNWASHPADAFCTAAVAAREPIEKLPPKPAPPRDLSRGYAPFR